MAKFGDEIQADLARHRLIAEGEATLKGIGGGKKFDREKIRLELVPHDAVWAAARVFTFGARKYEDRNWEKGITYSRLVGALRGHVDAFFAGHDLDPESGEPHLGHAMCCLMMLTALHLRGRNDLDDRPKEAVPTSRDMNGVET